MGSLNHNQSIVKKNDMLCLVCLFFILLPAMCSDNRIESRNINSTIIADDVADSISQQTPLSKYGLKPGDIIRIKNKKFSSRSFCFKDKYNNTLESVVVKSRKTIFTSIPEGAIDIEGLVLGDKSLNFAVVSDYPATSLFVTEELKHTLLGAKIKIPKPKVRKTIRVSNFLELSQAIDRFNKGESLTIKLLSDIGISSGININNADRSLIIKGNGHCIYPIGGVEYVPQGYLRNNAYCVLKGEDLGSLVTEKGTLVRQGRSKVYSAQSPVLNEDGSVSSNATGIKKIRIPKDLSLGPFEEKDNVYIYYTVGFTKKSSVITKIEGGYLYFKHTSDTFNPNSDYNKFGKHIAFQIINYEDGEGYYTRGGKLYYPATLKKLYNPSFAGGLFNINNSNGTIAFYDIVLKSRGPYQYNVINTINTGTIIVQNCVIVDVYNGIYDKSTKAGGSIYIDNCFFKNVYCMGVYPGENSAIITHNKCLNVGGCGYNYGQCLRAGHGISYIGYNELVNYGYCGIIASNTTCVIEHNFLKYTSDYFSYAEEFLAEDSGAIYTGQNNKNLIIRYNTIINYTGRFHNSGIYLDDGVNNTKVIGNIIENIPNYYAIYARDDGRTEGNRNTGRLIAYNIMDNGIMLRGSKDITPNNTYLGYNIICSKAQTIISHVGYLTQEERQFLTPNVLLKNGVVISDFDYGNWYE